MALFGNKKVNNSDETFRPEQLEKFEDKGDKQVANKRNMHIFNRFSAKRDAKDISKQTKWKRIAGVATVAIIVVLAILWLVSWLLTTIGDLVIDVEDSAAKKGIVVSANADGSDPSLRLTAENVKEVTNITRDWLPANLDNEKDGSHNGKNYLAYTFYLSNNGSETLDYISTLKMVGVAKSADEALRIMVYKNGEPKTYGKINLDGSTPVIAEETFSYTEPFKDVEISEKGKQEEVVFSEKNEGLTPGSSDKYTIVTWIEGEDQECIDDIMGGYCKLMWFFNVDGEEL